MLWKRYPGSDQLRLLVAASGLLPLLGRPSRGGCRRLSDSKPKRDRVRAVARRVRGGRRSRSADPWRGREGSASSRNRALTAFGFGSAIVALLLLGLWRWC